MNDRTGITAREWLYRARRSLTARDPASGHEAGILLRSVLGVRPSDSIRHPDRSLSAEELRELDRLLEARLGGMPLQYLTKVAPFRHLEIEVGPGVFVPRPETEGLVDIVLGFLKERRSATVLELCAGSGAILASLLSENPSLSGHAVELSPLAIRYAAANFGKAGVVGRVTLHAGDLYEPLSADQRFSVVVANPPYIPDGLWEDLPADVRDFEPRTALLGGPDGAGVIRRIIHGAPRFLESPGLLALEIDESHGETVRRLIEDAGAFEEARIEPDLAGRTRYAVAISRGPERGDFRGA